MSVADPVLTAVLNEEPSGQPPLAEDDLTGIRDRRRRSNWCEYNGNLWRGQTAAALAIYDALSAAGADDAEVEAAWPYRDGDQSVLFEGDPLDPDTVTLIAQMPHDLDALLAEVDRLRYDLATATAKLGRIEGRTHLIRPDEAVERLLLIRGDLAHDGCEECEGSSPCVEHSYLPPVECPGCGLVAPPRTLLRNGRVECWCGDSWNEYPLLSGPAVPPRTARDYPPEQVQRCPECGQVNEHQTDDHHWPHGEDCRSQHDDENSTEQVQP